MLRLEPVTRVSNCPYTSPRLNGTYVGGAMRSLLLPLLLSVVALPGCEPNSATIGSHEPARAPLAAGCWLRITASSSFPRHVAHEPPPIRAIASVA